MIEVLDEVVIEIDWVVGILIGVVNVVILVGNLFEVCVV